MSRTYTEEELQELLQNQADKIEAKHFEDKTEEVLKEHNQILKRVEVRLNEANGYKSTIGKVVNDTQTRVKAIEDRLSKNEEKWYQDKWMRRIALGALIVTTLSFFGTTVWEAENIYLTIQQGATVAHPVK